MDTRIADASLADRFEAARGPWDRITRPVLGHIGDLVSELDLSGHAVACCHHVLDETPPILLPLVRAGARVRIAAVNADSTDDAAAAALVRHGVDVWAWAGMSEAERLEGIERLVAEPADAVSDMGGEVIERISVERLESPSAALEATTSGITRLADLDIRFPVFDWNGIPMKDRLHNRHHVGIQAWPAFCDITGLALHGRSVLVVGFGPVGRGVAIQARWLGALVSVVELDPIRAMEAQQYGCQVVDLEAGLASCAIVVTATGREGVVGPDQLSKVRPGAILANVGHSNHEIDVAWLDSHPHETVRRYIDRYELADRELYLLNRGSLVNLAPGAGTWIDELFEPFAAVILRGLAWILEGGAADAPPGLQPYPAHLEREIAALCLDGRS